MHSILQENCSKSRRFLGLRPRWGAYDAPPDLLVVGASCLRQSQLLAFGACNFLDMNILVLKNFFAPHGLKPNSAYG